MKTVKYVLGVFFILGGIGALAQGSIGAGLLIAILGALFLPPVSDSLKEKVELWQNKAVRYVSYIVLFGIGGALAGNAGGLVKERSTSVSYENEKKEVSKTPYESYLKKNEKIIANFSEEKKQEREEMLAELHTNIVYKTLVEDKVVSTEYIPVIYGISNILNNFKGDSSVILESLRNQIASSKNSEEKLSFIGSSVGLIPSDRGGFSKELLEVFERYRKKYNYYGEKSVVVGADGFDEQIEPYDFSPLFVVLDPNNKKVLDAVYEARQNGISSWLPNDEGYEYAYVLSKRGYNEHLRKVYPKSPYFVDVDIEISAQQLYAEYEANEVAADKKFKGKKIAVSGVIGDIGKDILDKPYVSLEIGYLQSVNCYFSDKHNEEISTLGKGQGITIIGTCKGKSLGIMVTLDKCRILE